MRFMKFLSVLICGLVLSLCLSPTEVMAAYNSKPVSEVALAESTSQNVPTTAVMVIPVPHPVCEHTDPYYGLHPKSTMRYINTGTFWNPIELRYDIRDWYQCTVCGYETFWVHGYKYNE